VRIGVTAVWHSHRHTCSIQKVERSPRENRSCRRPANIPPAVREAPAFTPERMSLNKQLYDSMYDFIIDSVTTVARDARKERDEIKELKNQPNDVQADRAFESLQEI